VKSGDVVIGLLLGARIAKVRPAVVLSSELYLRERPDAMVGILTTQTPLPPASTDYVLRDWQAAGLRMVSWFRLYLITVQQADLSNIGRVSPHDWAEIQARIRTGFGI